MIEKALTYWYGGPKDGAVMATPLLLDYQFLPAVAYRDHVHRYSLTSHATDEGYPIYAYDGAVPKPVILIV